MATQTWTSGTCTCTLDDNGVFTISPTDGISGQMENYKPDVDMNTSAPWGKLTNIKVINIEDGVTSIGNYAFCKVTSISTVNFPVSITSIGSSAFGFSNNTKFNNLDKCINVATVSGFSSSTLDNSFKLPPNAVEISSYAFSNTAFFDSHYLIDLQGIKKIGNEAFSLNVSFGTNKGLKWNMPSSFPTDETMYDNVYDLFIVPESVETIGTNLTATLRGSAVPNQKIGHCFKTIDYRANTSTFDFDSFKFLKTETLINRATVNQTCTGVIETSANKNMICYGYPENIGFKNKVGSRWRNIAEIITDWDIETVHVSFNSVLGSLSITGEGPLPDYASIDDLPWNFKLSNITNIEIGENITKLGNYSLAGMTNLTKIINKSKMNQIISDTAFYGDTALISLYGYPENENFKSIDLDKWIDINSMAAIAPFTMDGKEVYPKTVDDAVIMYDNRNLKDTIVDLIARVQALESK